MMIPFLLIVFSILVSTRASIDSSTEIFNAVGDVDPVSQLYPFESETRLTKNLNGIWRFRLGDRGFKEEWYSEPWIDDWQPMAVPGSWQDQSPDPTLRDHVGWAFYQTDFYARASEDQSLLLYFGAVDQNAIVWVNGMKVGKHLGGHVSFVLDVTAAASASHRCLLTVAVNNTLTPWTIPQATKTYIGNATSRYPAGTWLYSHSFDYFDYSGINRNVLLYTVPKAHIIDVTADTGFTNGQGLLNLSVMTSREADSCEVVIFDKKGTPVLNMIERSFESSTFQDGSIRYDFMGAEVNSVNPWITENPTLYTLQVNVSFTDGSWDIYERPIGFRSVAVKKWKLFLNDKPIYLRGVGMHEDTDIRGRGWDAATAVRDSSLISWMGINAIRTSHYPYSEELLQEFDRIGIAVILELPACSLSSFNSKILAEHIRVARDVIPKYRHHPSIIAWSMANEPQSNKNESRQYFMNVSAEIRKLDPTRPITFVSSQQPYNEKSIDAVDFICVNRYSGWYQDPGRLDLIEYQVDQELRAWAAFGKPLIITEYGAGTVSGQHTLPADMWSEDYQTVLLQHHFNAFDRLRKEGLLTGEMIWNFHDFNTPQGYTRPGMNMKGIMTRQRQPKTAARAAREHYMNIAKE